MVGCLAGFPTGDDIPTMEGNIIALWAKQHRFLSLLLGVVALEFCGNIRHGINYTCWWFRNPANRWRLEEKIPTYSRVLYIPGPWLVVSTHLKNSSQIASFPQVRVKKKNETPHLEKGTKPGCRRHRFFSASHPMGSVAPHRRVSIHGPWRSVVHWWQSSNYCPAAHEKKKHLPMSKLKSSLRFDIATKKRWIIIWVLSLKSFDMPTKHVNI